jgi:hypothetical protein
MTKPSDSTPQRTDFEIEPPLAPAAREILRGVQRVLKAHGFESLSCWPTAGART